MVMGAGKLSNGFIRTGTRIQLETLTQQYRKHCALFKILFSWSQNSFLDSCAERISNGRWGGPEHRILGLWERCNPTLTTSHQPPQSKLPLKDSFQFYSKFVSIFTIFTFHCQTGKGCVCVCQLLRKARGPINQVEQ